MRSLAALADPTRRRILEMLAERELSAGEIAARFELSGSAISQHLKVLRQSRLVRVRTDAQRRIYALERDGLREVETWIGNLRQAGQPDTPERRLIKRTLGQKDQ